MFYISTDKKDNLQFFLYLVGLQLILELRLHKSDRGPWHPVVFAKEWQEQELLLSPSYPFSSSSWSSPAPSASVKAAGNIYLKA